MIGIEGGGTRTRALVARDSNAPVYYEWPSSIKVRNNDFAASAATLRSLLHREHLLSQSSEPVLAIAIGLAGLSRTEDQNSLETALRALPEFAFAHIHLEGDATLALRSALGEHAPGILLISGTGSVAFARDEEGKVHRAGGYGPPNSDEGSGWWIGKQAAESGKWSVVNGEFASLARSVFDDAIQSEEKSELALTILRSAGEELAKLVRDAARQAGLARGNLYLSGSVAKHRLMMLHLSELLREFQLHPLEERAPVRTALEIARTLCAN